MVVEKPAPAPVVPQKPVNNYVPAYNEYDYGDGLDHSRLDGSVMSRPRDYTLNGGTDFYSSTKTGEDCRLI